MRHQVAHLDVLLAGRRELGPVLGDLAVEVELAPIGEHQRTQRGHRLGRRPDVDDRVALPRRRLRLVDVAAPQVDDELAVEDDGDRRADIEALVEVLRERRLDRCRSADRTCPGCQPLVPLASRADDIGGHDGGAADGIEAVITVVRCASPARWRACSSDDYAPSDDRRPSDCHDSSVRAGAAHRPSLRHSRVARADRSAIRSRCRSAATHRNRRTIKLWVAVVTPADARA